jgi:hypothetical protein
MHMRSDFLEFGYVEQLEAVLDEMQEETIW